jgi:uncharacterized protein YlxW (UPF0749 family)
VAGVLALAGLLFATSASTSRGTQLRSERADLADLVAADTLKVKNRTQQVAGLHAQVERDTAANAVGNSAVQKLESRSAGLAAAAGLTPVTGPGLVVTLDDAPKGVVVPAQAGPDDLVVHQQDVQAVVNALWAGGAEAMMLQDQRVISTSAVRCVGNTLILQGRVYSPPYSIAAIGDITRLRAALAASPEISYYKEYVAALQLGWAVEERTALKLPAYSGSLTLRHATSTSAPATQETTP